MELPLSTELPGRWDWEITLPCPLTFTRNPLFSRIYKASFKVIPLTSGTWLGRYCLLFQLIERLLTLATTHSSESRVWLEIPISLHKYRRSSKYPAFTIGKIPLSSSHVLRGNCLCI